MANATPTPRAVTTPPRKFASYLALLALVATVIMLFAVPWLNVNNLTVQILGFTLINVVAMQGLTVLYGWADQVSLATGAFFGFGAYVQALGTVRFEISPWLLIPIAVAAGWALGAMVGLPALRLKGHYLAMGTLAFSSLMVLLFTEADWLTGGVDGLGNIPYPHLPILGEALKRVPSVYLLAVVAAIGSIWFTRNIVRGVPGHCMGAMAASEDGARSCGVEVERITVRAFAYSGAMAALAGALYAMMVGFISPSLLGVHASIAFVAMAVIGGRKTVVGPVLSTIALTVIQQIHLLIPGLNYEVAEVLKSVQTEVYAVLIIVLVLFAPGGIASIRLWRTRLHETGGRER